MKMTKNGCNFSLFLFLIAQFVLSSISVLAIESDGDQSKKGIFYLRNFDTSTTIDGILSYEWTKNRECLIELNEIKKGLENHEEWALKGEQKFYFIKYHVTSNQI